MDARAGGVQGELADGDAHSVRAEVAQAKDPLPVRDDDDADIAVRPVGQDLPKAALVLEGEIQSPRAAENMPELHAPLAYRRGVDNGHHLLDVVHDHPVEEGLLAVLERDQVDELLDVARLAMDVFQHARHLLLQGGHAGRKQPAQAQSVTLLFREGGSLVDVRIMQQVDSPFPVHVQMKMESVGHEAPPVCSPRKRRLSALRLRFIRLPQPESGSGRFIAHPGFQNFPTCSVHITLRFRPSHFALNSASSLRSRRRSIESVSDRRSAMPKLAVTEKFRLSV